MSTVEADDVDGVVVEGTRGVHMTLIRPLCPHFPPQLLTKSLQAGHLLGGMFTPESAEFLVLKRIINRKHSSYMQYTSTLVGIYLVSPVESTRRRYKRREASHRQALHRSPPTSTPSGLKYRCGRDGLGAKLPFLVSNNRFRSGSEDPKLGVSVLLAATRTCADPQLRTVFSKNYTKKNPRHAI